VRIESRVRAPSDPLSRRGVVSSTADRLLSVRAGTVSWVGPPTCLISAAIVLKRLTGTRQTLPVTG
jgi:hypothetical protein